MKKKEYANAYLTCWNATSSDLFYDMSKLGWKWQFCICVPPGGKKQYLLPNVECKYTQCCITWFQVVRDSAFWATYFGIKISSILLRFFSYFHEKNMYKIRHGSVCTKKLIGIKKMPLKNRFWVQNWLKLKFSTESLIHIFRLCCTGEFQVWTR